MGDRTRSAAMAHALSSALRRLGPIGAGPAVLVELTGASAGLVEQVVVMVATASRPSGAPGDTRLELSAPSASSAPAEPTGASPRELMMTLLDQALAQNAATSEEAYLTSLVRQLLPDEARIVAALASGEAAPTVSVHSRSSGRVLVDNASLVGRTAAVTLPSRTTHYVAHLLHLGLVELGPEDPDNAIGYELVLAEREVRAALREGALSKLPARVTRRTLRLSELGRTVWRASGPEETS